MGSSLFMQWLKAVQELREKKVQEKLCPTCGKGTISYLYIGDEITKFGVLKAWCSNCMTGIYMTRVKALPTEKNFVSLNQPNDIRLKNIPQFKELTPASKKRNTA